MYYDSYDQLESEANHYGEKNDCAVRAVAAATQTAYGTVHRFMELCGRRRKRGTERCVTQEVVDKLGYAMVETKFRARTTRTLAREAREGTYLVFVRKHVYALVDGKVLDWSEGRCHRIQRVYRIVRKSWAN